MRNCFWYSHFCIKLNSESIIAIVCLVSLSLKIFIHHPSPLGITEKKTFVTFNNDDRRQKKCNQKYTYSSF